MKIDEERKKLIDFILNYASDEIETIEDWYNLSIMSIDELKQNKKNIKNFNNN